jgi:hypothetical protein
MYEIKIMGVLRHDWSEWFTGLSISHFTDESGITITTLSGKIDHSALQGILNRVFSLNLKLLSVTRLGFDKEKGESYK